MPNKTLYFYTPGALNCHDTVNPETGRGHYGDKVLAPGGLVSNPWDALSLGIALMFGTAGLPHILMRFYTVPTAKEARRSVVWAIALIGAFYLFTLILGYGAAVFVGKDAILAAPGGVNSAAPALAYHLGGEILLGVIAGTSIASPLNPAGSKRLHSAPGL